MIIMTSEVMFHLSIKILLKVIYQSSDEFQLEIAQFIVTISLQSKFFLYRFLIN